MWIQLNRIIMHICRIVMRRPIWNETDFDHQTPMRWMRREHWPTWENIYTGKIVFRRTIWQWWLQNLTCADDDTKVADAIVERPVSPTSVVLVSSINAWKRLTVLPLLRIVVDTVESLSPHMKSAICKFNHLFIHFELSTNWILIYRLGCVHDGSPPPSYLGGPGATRCPWEDGFIMSDLRHTERGFRWSSCSVEQFKHFLK